jgi:hypothetical protein
VVKSTGRCTAVFVAALILSSATRSAAQSSEQPDAHMFGVLPNYSTVEEGEGAGRLTPKDMFKSTALNTFDPWVFPFVGLTAGISDNGRQAYGARYATALADNSIGNFMTSAILPAALKQDPRYYQSGRGSILRRIGYAASRSVITRSQSGHAQFNVSEIGGNAVAAGVSNFYYVPSERTVTGTVGRWGMQVLWDTLSNEMKEFWPDVRAGLHHVRTPRE